MADIQTRAKLLNNLVVRNLKCQMNGGPNKQGGRKQFQNLMNGVKINGGMWEFEKWLQMSIKRWKGQK